MRPAKAAGRMLREYADSIQDADRSESHFVAWIVTTSLSSKWGWRRCREGASRPQPLEHLSSGIVVDDVGDLSVVSECQIEPDREAEPEDDGYLPDYFSEEPPRIDLADPRSPRKKLTTTSRTAKTSASTTPPRDPSSLPLAIRR
jgi:hypothetical protein